MPDKRKALGQHMLVDRRVLAKIVSAANIKNETVCEAGTGHGILTEELCKLAKKVISYEIDPSLYKQAQARLQFQNLELVNADLFKAQVKFDVFVSNLPYSRSRDAFEWLATQSFGRAIVMVQQEFADKLAARPGVENYRAISALAAHCFAIEKLFNVRKESFEPPPTVESAVIKITPKNMVRKETVKSLNLLFSKRNKKASSVAAKAGIKIEFGDSRIDQLASDDVVKLAESMENVRPI
jgi:16S rRNA (adenine1518-N6/adenine1519-N6)-dimethyltransferase